MNAPQGRVYIQRPLAAKLKVGDRVVHESVNDRGYILRTVGVIDWVERSLASRLTAFCTVEVEGVYVYHPVNPQEGRELPAVRRECFDCEACVVIGRAA